jgi:hypothetical protein
MERIVIDVDEKAFCKGHRYMTIVSDIDRGTVEVVADGRKSQFSCLFQDSDATRD